MFFMFRSIDPPCGPTAVTGVFQPYRFGILLPDI
jgi:hypothetical protein